MTVRNDLGIDPAVALENTEDDGLAAGSPAAFSANSPAPKVRLIDLDLAGLKWGMTSAFFDQSETDFLKDRINTFPSNLGQLGCFTGRQIHCEIAQNLAKFLLGNSGTAIIAV